MIVNFTHYLQNLQLNFQRGSERSHYPTLKALIDDSMIGINAVIEEKGNQAGIPDFTVRKNGQLVGYIEAKDMNRNLDIEEKTEQLERYRESSVGQNLILTNYLEFRWYVDGKLKQTAAIAYLEKDIIIAYEKTEAVVQLLQLFLGYRGKDINNYYDLAGQMAVHTKSVKYSIEEALKLEDKTGELTQLKVLFQDLLLPDLDNDTFADMYAQTIAYGLFTARVGHAQNPGQDLFSRKTASHFISNKIPFLQGLFNTVIETDFISKIHWTIEDLVELFIKVDMGSVLERFGQETRRQDPVVHFYETFLAAYESSLRKNRGVYYTPEPVVSFIVQAVNDILDKDFDINFGLGNRRVTILDPATGTGTFLYEVIKQVYRNFERYGVNKWNDLLRESQLLSRLYGFELLMTPYTIAHLKLALYLESIGYKFEPEERLNIYLTNALEEGIKESDLIVAKFLSDESNQAADIKTNVPIIVVLGNPPYSVSSQNASKRKRVINQDTQYLADIKYNGLEWEKVYKTGKAGKTITELTHIGELLELYKGRVRLEGEKNIQPLDDDYIKFIRFAQYQIQKTPTGYGIVGFITNHSYLNGLIHRGMREELLKYFDTLYIMDLHGNKETTPEGGIDQNVFDIQQGVAILLALREKTEPDYFSKVYKDRSGVKEMAKVFYYDLWGKREAKYKFLEEVKFREVEWIELQPTQPNYFFAPKNFDLATEYNQGWNISDIFLINSSGIKTHRDHFVIDFDKEVLLERIQDFLNPNTIQNDIENKYHLKESNKFDFQRIKTFFLNLDIESFIYPILYRPFDKRYIFFSELFCERLRKEIMNNLILENLALILPRQQKEIGFQHCFVTDEVGDGNTISLNSREYNYYFPLYIYPDTENQQGNLFLERTPNFSPEFLTAIKEKLGYTPTPEKIFYYAYAIFHSPTYRQRYAEFLKIDFPRLPFTKNDQLFNNLATQGEQLVNLHLLKSEQFNQLITTYEGEGNNQVSQVIYNDQLQRVYINPQKYFANIPKQIWEFKIGGYQVLEKWLKDRKKCDRALSDEDIIHYQKIVVALQQTLKIMTEIDQLIPSFPIE
jgi:predicted helicase